MLRAGLLKEVATLLSQGAFPIDHPATKAIGYRQTIDYLCEPENFNLNSSDVNNSNLGAEIVEHGAATEVRVRSAAKAFVSEFATATRNYAKRQLAWYRKDPHFLFVKIF